MNSTLIQDAGVQPNPEDPASTQTETALPFPPNPLLGFQLTTFKNWNAYLKRWDDQSLTFHERLGLLHFIFETPYNDAPVYGRPGISPYLRIIFCLSLADGWNKTESLYSEADRLALGESTTMCHRDKSGFHQHIPMALARKMIATKAFALVVPEICKPLAGRDQHELWQQVVYNEFLFPAIMHFFRVEQIQITWTVKRIRNLNTEQPDKYTPHEKMIVEFLLACPFIIWSWEGSRDSMGETRERRAATLARMADAKLWIIDVLAILKRLDVLEDPRFTIDDTCIAKLEDITRLAMIYSGKHPIRESRLVTSLHEAVFAGSQAALFLLRHKIIQEERARLERIQELQQAQARATQELAALTPAGAQT